MAARPTLLKGDDQAYLARRTLPLAAFLPSSDIQSDYSSLGLAGRNPHLRLSRKRKGKKVGDAASRQLHVTWLSQEYMLSYNLYNIRNMISPVFCSHVSLSSMILNAYASN